MSLQRIQECEPCGETRVLREHESPKTGGWRTLSAGSLEATMCNKCVRAVVEDALKRKAERDDPYA